MNWVQFNSLGGVVSRTVAEQFGRGILIIIGQLHPAFVAFAAGSFPLKLQTREFTLQLGEALERNPQKTPIDPFLEVCLPPSPGAKLTLPFQGFDHARHSPLSHLTCLTRR